MSKQTAVEWLIEQINNVKPHQFCSIETIKKWCEQAKAIEREQIIDAVDVGFEEGCKLIEDIRLNNGEQYYNKTYKGGER